MRNHPTHREIKFALLSFFALVALVATSSWLFLAETSAGTTKFTSQPEIGEDHLLVIAKLLAIDPIKGDITFRLQFEPQGKLLDEVGNNRETLYLDLNSSSGKVQVTFKAGERMNPMDVTLSLYDSTVMLYPFDRHSAELFLLVSKENAGTYKSVPVYLEYSAMLAGYTLQTTSAPEQQADYLHLLIGIQRSFSARFFAIFIMLLEWLLAFLAIVAVWSWCVRGNKMEVGMFGWMGALLFSLVPLRNAMPGIPTFGTLSDYLSLFWVIAIIAICMAIAILHWALYRAKPD